VQYIKNLAEGSNMLFPFRSFMPYGSGTQDAAKRQSGNAATRQWKV